MAAGIASSPHLLARSGTTPGVYEARKSLGWAVLVVGIVCLTLPAVAVYLRYLVFDQVVGQPVERLPGWFQALQQAGIARIESRTTTVSMGRLGFERDAILFALPVAAGFPQVLTYLALAGAFAATLCALSASLFTAASILAEDMTRADTTGIATDRARLGKARIALIGVGGLAIALAVASPADPLQLFLWMVTLCASAAFPVLFLSIWWRRASAWGAMVGMLAGFAAAAVTILLAEAGALAIPSSLAGAIGIPCGLLATIMASLAVKTSDSRLLEHVHEMRVPGGETIHDREVRLLRLKSRTPA
jgi:cation/acetate symporter